MATDEQLIQQIREGKSEAYGQLFGKYYRQTYSVCFAILHNSHDAEEVTNDTFVHAYLKLDQLRKPDKFFGWLRKIAQNRSKNFLRDKPNDTIPLNLASAQTAAQVAPDALLLRQELIAAIMEAIESLPPKDREVIQAHIDGLNHSEISKQLGISIEASKSRLYRVRKKIAVYVKDLLNAIVFLPNTPPFKKIISGGIEAMKVGTSKGVTTGIITVTQSLMFSVIFHVALFISLSFFLPYKFHADRQKVDIHLEVSLLPPAKEQQPAQRPSKGEEKSVVSVKSSFSLINKESPKKAPRGFLSAGKPASQGEIGETISKIGQDTRELQIGAGVSVKSREKILSGSRNGGELLSTVGVERESVSEVGKVGVGLAGEVAGLAKGRGGMDLEIKKIERLKPVIPQRERFGKQAGLSMIGDIGVADADDTLANVAKDMILDQTGFGMPELPKGEPGGIVVGKGKDLRGYLRFPRFTCSMVDDRVVLCFVSKVLPTLMKWLNTNTNIKVDMNVEGGRVSPMDAALFKSPIVFLFGQDEMIASIFSSSEPSTWASYKTFTVPYPYPLPRASKHLSKMERERIRKYLLEKGGILFIDTQPRINAVAKKGKWAPGQEFPWSMRMKQELREILPEYSLQRIPNEHELFHCYYELDGAPPGPHPSWNFQFWHAKTPYLEGISVDGHLAVIYSEMWYWAAITYDNYNPIKPSVFRFLTNTVVYALTHSGVSDKSRYVPPEKEIPVEIPTKPSVIPPPTPNLRPR